MAPGPCKLCHATVELHVHFIATCPALEVKCRELLALAPPHINLPDSSFDTASFTESILGVHWIGDADTQEFFLLTS